MQQQERIKKNTLARQAEIALQQRQEALVNKAVGVGASGAGDDLDMLLDDSDHHDGSDGHDDGNVDDHHDHDQSDEDSDHDELDVMAAIRKRQKTIRKELKAAEVRGDITAAKGVHATRWEDSHLAREQAMREAVSTKEAGKQDDSAAAAASSLLNVRDPQNHLAQEAALREEEKGRVHGKDPLGIIPPGEEEIADLRQIEHLQAEQMEKALYEIQEEIQKAESAGTDDHMKKAIYQKESLEQLVEKLGGLETMENNSKASILPTNSRFNSLLFLTLLHRKTTYKELMKSMERLSSTLFVIKINLCPLACSSLDPSHTHAFDPRLVQARRKTRPNSFKIWSATTSLCLFAVLKGLKNFDATQRQKSGLGSTSASINYKVLLNRQPFKRKRPSNRSWTTPAKCAKFNRQ